MRGSGMTWRERDRSLRERSYLLRREAARVVQDGMKVGVGGSTMSRTPMALIWELIRQHRKHVEISRCLSTDGDLVIGSDIADTVVTAGSRRASGDCRR